jgi:hypothetical protein
MRKEFIVTKIEAAQDGSRYVYIGLIDPNDYKSGEAKQLNPFGPRMMAFSSSEDLMKNLPKAMGNVAGMMGAGVNDSPTFRFRMREYEEMGLKVGEKVSIEIKKSGNSGV